MRIQTIRPLGALSVAFLISMAIGGMSARAQSAPSGSCALPDGSWCWPVAPTSYGQRCFCPDGRAGVGQ